MFNMDVNVLCNLPAMPNTRIIDKALALAKERGMNQSQFAEAVGVAPANVTNWKARDLPPSMLSKVAAVLGTTVDGLIGSAKIDTPPQAPGRWPLRSVSPEMLERLPSDKREQLERVLCALLELPRPDDWRSYATSLAADTDIQMNTNAFSAFVSHLIAAYDAPATAAAHTAPRSRKAHTP